MRIILLLFILIFSSKPSYFNGDYSDAYHGMIGATWHFEKDGTFTYSEANCEGGRVGKGVYKIEGDSVHFIFQRPETSNIPSKLEAKKLNNAASAWALDVELRDRETNGEIIFAVISVSDASGNKLKDAATDLDGKATLLIPDQEGAIFISVMYAGYSNPELKLETPGNYSIKGTMSQNFGPAGIAEGTHYDYKLLSAGKKSMRWQTTEMHPDTTRIIELMKYKPR